MAAAPSKTTPMTERETTRKIQSPPPQTTHTPQQWIHSRPLDGVWAPRSHDSCAHLVWLNRALVDRAAGHSVSLSISRPVAVRAGTYPVYSHNPTLLTLKPYLANSVIVVFLISSRPTGFLLPAPNHSSPCLVSSSSSTPPHPPTVNLQQLTGTLYHPHPHPILHLFIKTLFWHLPPHLALFLLPNLKFPPLVALKDPLCSPRPSLS